MEKFIKTLLLGTAAGILDVIPMAFQGLNWQTNLAAFLHWLGLGILITYFRLPLAGWLSGIVIALLTGIPTAVHVSAATPMAIFPIIISSIVLGGLLGYMSDKTITGQDTL